MVHGIVFNRDETLETRLRAGDIEVGAREGTLAVDDDGLRVLLLVFDWISTPLSIWLPPGSCERQRIVSQSGTDSPRARS